MFGVEFSVNSGFAAPGTTVAAAGVDRVATWKPRGAQLGEEAARRLRHLMPQAIQSGLTEAECARAEGRFGFEFADDHRAFLLAGLPAGRRWPDWLRRSPQHVLGPRLE